MRVTLIRARTIFAHVLNLRALVQEVLLNVMRKVYEQASTRGFEKKSLYHTEIS